MGLADGRCISLTTFKRDGTPVATPMWVVRDGTRLFVRTGATTWKVKRLRRDPRVLVAPCDSRGKLQGPQVEGTGRIAEELPLVDRLMREKYRWQDSGLGLFGRLTRAITRKPRNQVAIELDVPESS
jgi:PPOX class probable F420-dependent enzyme